MKTKKRLGDDEKKILFETSKILHFVTDLGGFEPPIFALLASSKEYKALLWNRRALLY